MRRIPSSRLRGRSGRNYSDRGRHIGRRRALANATIPVTVTLYSTPNRPGVHARSDALRRTVIPGNWHRGNRSAFNQEDEDVSAVPAALPVIGGGSKIRSTRRAPQRGPSCGRRGPPAACCARASSSAWQRRLAAERVYLTWPPRQHARRAVGLSQRQPVIICEIPYSRSKAGNNSLRARNNSLRPA